MILATAAPAAPVRPDTDALAVAPPAAPVPAVAPAEAVRRLLEDSARRSRAARAPRRRWSPPPAPSALWNGPALWASAAAGLALTWMAFALCFLLELNLALPAAQWFAGQSGAGTAQPLIMAKK